MSEHRGRQEAGLVGDLYRSAPRGDWKPERFKKSKGGIAAQRPALATPDLPLANMGGTGLMCHVLFALYGMAKCSGGRSYDLEHEPGRC